MNGYLEAVTATWCFADVCCLIQLNRLIDLWRLKRKGDKGKKPNAWNNYQPKEQMKQTNQTIKESPSLKYSSPITEPIQWANSNQVDYQKLHNGYL